MKKTRILFNTFILISALLVYTSSVQSTDVSFKTAIVFKDNSALHKKTINAIVSKLKKQYGNNIQFIFIDANSHKSFSYDDAMFIISVGRDAAKLILETTPKQPVLFTLIPQQTLHMLFNTYKHNTPKSNYYSIVINQPLLRKFRLAKILLRKNITVGMTIGKKDLKSEKYIFHLAHEAGIKINLSYTSNFNKAIDAIKQSLINSDIFIAQHDVNSINRHTAKWLLYMSYKNNIPVIGYSPSFTKAGAVTAIFSTPEQIGKQSAEWLVAMTLKKPVQTLQYPKYFMVDINKQVLRILRLKNITHHEIESKIQKLERGHDNELNE